MSDPLRTLDFDIVVVGAGPAGLAAASVAAESGRRVALLEASPWLGGQIWRGEEAHPTDSAARRWLDRLQRSGARVFRSTTVFAAPAPGVVLAERGADGCVPGSGSDRRDRAADGEPGTGSPAGLSFSWRKLVVATGARELFLPFPGWTLPNVVGAGGLSALVKSGLTVRDKRVVVAGSGPLLLAVAAEVRRHGASIVCLAEQAGFGSLARFGAALPWLAPAKLIQGLAYQHALRGVRYRPHCWPVRAIGSDRVEAVELTDGRRRWTERCDYLACGFGLVPNLELPRLLGCRTEVAHTPGAADSPETGGIKGLPGEPGEGPKPARRESRPTVAEAAWTRFVRVGELQESSVPHVFCAGEPTGIGGAERAVIEGQIAGLAASGREAEARRLLTARERQERFTAALARAFALRPELKLLADLDTIVCRCEDVSRAALESCTGWHEAKLHTRCGMGPCQGRICGGATRALFGWDADSIRPPVLPVSVGALLQSNPGSR